MKQLYYNPIELPEKIRIKSSCFNINVEYAPQESDGKPVFLQELFYLSKSESFDAVEVYLTSHNAAYIKTGKKATIGTRISGWVSLKKYGNGGGYLEDQHLLSVKD